MLNLARAVVLTALALAAAPASAATLETFNIGGWVGGAYSNDRTGEFSHCAVSIPYRSGIVLLFSVGRNFTWSMGLSNAQWRLTPGAEYDLTYYIDGGASMLARGRALNPLLIEVPLTNSTALFDDFRRGRVLTVQSAGATFTFSLKNSGKALAATLECTQRYVGRIAPPPRDPFVDRPPSHDAGEGARKSEAIVLLADVLATTGVQNFKVLTRDETPADLRRWSAVWSAPGLTGVLDVIEPQTASQAEQVASFLTSTQAQACKKGNFSSQRLPSQPGSRTLRLRTGCGVDATARSSEANYTIVPRYRGGGFYVFGIVADAPNFAPARETDDRLYEAVIQLR
jgi:hypothetical protein